MAPRPHSLSAAPSVLHAAGATAPTASTTPAAPFAFSIAEGVAATGGAITRTRMFALIRAGEVDARKVGRRTVIVADSLRDYLMRQPRAVA